MTSTRPDLSELIGKDPEIVPLSAQRVLQNSSTVETIWIGPDQAKQLTDEEVDAYQLAKEIMIHLAIDAPRKHKSGHPGGPLSAFTFSYGILRRRDLQKDAALRMSAGHLSVLAYGLQYLGGRNPDDPRLSSPQAIIDTFRVPDGLPGHAEAGIGDIPFGFGPLGKGLSNGVGHALGWKMQGKTGMTDVLMGDGESQEGQITEAARIASFLELDHLVLHVDLNDIQLTEAPSDIIASDLATMYKAMGWAVIEVQNGNDPAQVEAALDMVDTLSTKGRPIIVCYYTTMGHGVEVMEKAANEGSAKFHGAPMNDEDAEEALSKIRPLDELVTSYEPYRKTLSSLYAKAGPASQALENPPVLERALLEEKGAARKEFGALHIKNLMQKDDRIIVLHGDLAGSGGFDKVEKEFPNRVINCGAAEANMYMMAAGLRQAGMLPVTYTFAAFGTNEARANARLIDINSGHIPCGVLHDCTHAGLSVGEDGETHQERNYLNIPFDNTQIWCTADSNQAAAMVEKSFQIIAKGDQSVYVFMPRSGHEQLKKIDGTIFYDQEYNFEGKADMIRGSGDTNDQATIIAVGNTIHDAVAAADQLRTSVENPAKVRVLNIGCVRPIDSAAIIQAALETNHLIVVEDHHSEGGVATQVADIIADFSLSCSLRRLGVNYYFPSGPANDLKYIAGIDAESIMDATLDEIRTEVSGGEDSFVSTIHELMYNIHRSRFAESALEFVRRLVSEKGYLDTLRDYAISRECPKDSLPSNDDLLGKLQTL